MSKDRSAGAGLPTGRGGSEPAEASARSEIEAFVARARAVAATNASGRPGFRFRGERRPSGTADDCD